jgi:hypothetical protein
MASQTVEESFAIDAQQFAREGRLVPGYRGNFTGSQGDRNVVTVCLHVQENFLVIDRVSTPVHSSDTSIPIEFTSEPSTIGGERVRFVCVMCGRLTSRLYIPPGTSFLGCRLCHRLSYDSCQHRESGRRADLLSLGSAPIESRGPGHLLYGGQEEAGPAPEEEFAPKNPRPPGRPRTKRAYTRHQPFLAGERHTSSEGLCLRCRAYREPKDPARVTLRGGRSALRGTCPVCGAAMVQIIKKD